LGFAGLVKSMATKVFSSHFRQSTRLVTSPEVSHPSNDGQSHPLHQNPSLVASPMATGQLSNIKSPVLGTDHLGKSPRAGTNPSHNDLSPSPDQETTLVKSSQTTMRRFSIVQSLPPSQRNVLIKPPPLTTSKSGDIRSPPLNQRTVLVKSPPSATPKSSNVQSPPLGHVASLAKSPPTITRQLSIIPSPIVDQNGRFVEASPTITRQFSIIASPKVEQSSRSPIRGLGFTPGLA
jgi:hypothetical protein